jgi:hypothetical protein
MSKIVKPYDEVQINEHAAKCGGTRNLKEVIITDEDGVQYYFLVKRPTRSVVQASAVAVQAKDIKTQHKLAIGCVLEGDMEIIEQDGVMFAELLARIQFIGKTVTSEIKNF